MNFAHSDHSLLETHLPFLWKGQIFRPCQILNNLSQLRFCIVSLRWVLHNVAQLWEAVNLCRHSSWALRLSQVCLVIVGSKYLEIEIHTETISLKIPTKGKGLQLSAAGDFAPHEEIGAPFWKQMALCIPLDGEWPGSFKIVLLFWVSTGTKSHKIILLVESISPEKTTQNYPMSVS